VTLMSMHRSKGLEWHLVYVAGFADGIAPYWLSVREGKLESERRLAYVAVTRAKRRLVLSYPRARTTFAGRQEMRPSRFLAEMGLGHGGKGKRAIV
jgi:superfamily I DNA/RNA helicase